MKKRPALFVTFLVATFLLGATSLAVGQVMKAPAPKTVTPLPVINPAILQQQAVEASRNVLRTSDVIAVVGSVFKDAYFTANACGGTYTTRNTVLSMPNLLYRQEPMSRLEYELTSNEKEQTTSFQHRLSAIRACFKYWRSMAWGGMVANGKFVVVLQMATDGNAYADIEGRAMKEVWAAIMPFYIAWKDDYDWGDTVADENFSDYRFYNPRLEVIFTPVAVNGGIGFSAIEARWVMDSQGFTDDSKTYFETLKTKVINYKDSWMETIRMRGLVAFSDAGVQSRLAAGIVEQLRAKHYQSTSPVNAITGITGSGETITVQHN